MLNTMKYLKKCYNWSNCLASLFNILWAAYQLLLVNIIKILREALKLV